MMHHRYIHHTILFFALLLNLVKCEPRSGTATLNRQAHLDSPLKPTKDNAEIFDRLGKEKKKWKMPARRSRGPLTPEERKRFALVLGDKVDKYDPDFLRNHEDLMDELTFHNKEEVERLEGSMKGKKIEDRTKDEIDFERYNRVPPKLLLDSIKKFNNLQKRQQRAEEAKRTGRKSDVNQEEIDEAERMQNRLNDWKNKRRQITNEMVELKAESPEFKGFGQSGGK